MADDVVVVGVGMMTAVGLSAAETAASVRAGVARFAETGFRDHAGEPIVLAEVPEGGLPGLVAEREPDGDATAGTARELRLLGLALMPLRECLAALPTSAPPAGPPPLVLALPDPSRGRPLDDAALLGRLWRESDGAFDLRRSSAVDRGRAGGVVAIGRGVAMILQGQAEFVLVGGVDTYRDLFLLDTLDREGRVKSAANLDGFIPGEAGAFLLLASRAAAARTGLPALAAASPVATAMEAGHLYSDAPYRGEGLAAAVQALTQAGVAAGAAGEVYSSMNGESHWAKEWGVCVLRNGGAFAPDHGLHHPADACGDTGAACGVLMAGLAAIGLREGYRRGPCLVYGSSDGGPRAVLAVTAA